MNWNAFLIGVGAGSVGASVCLMACTPAQLDKARAASDAREYACRYLAVTTEPELAEARKRCEQGAELADVLAVAAGREACLESLGE